MAQRDHHGLACTVDPELPACTDSHTPLHHSFSSASSTLTAHSHWLACSSSNHTMSNLSRSSAREHLIQRFSTPAPMCPVGLTRPVPSGAASLPASGRLHPSRILKSPTPPFVSGLARNHILAPTRATA